MVFNKTKWSWVFIRHDNDTYKAILTSHTSEWQEKLSYSCLPSIEKKYVARFNISYGPLIPAYMENFAHLLSYKEIDLFTPIISIDFLSAQ